MKVTIVEKKKTEEDTAKNLTKDAKKLTIKMSLSRNIFHKALREGHGDKVNIEAAMI